MSTQPTSIILGQRVGALQADAPSSDFQYMIGKFVSILSARRWLFLYPLLGGMLVSLAVSLTLPRQYTLQAIFERRDDEVITKLIGDNSPYSFNTLRPTLRLDLMGYQSLSQAADELGLTADLPRNAQGELTPEGRAAAQQLILKLSESLSVKLLEKTPLLDLVEISYHGENPELGQKLVTQLKDNYIARTRGLITQILYKSRDFFANEAEKRRSNAATMEAELLQLAMTHPGINPSDPDLLSQRLTALNLSIEDLNLRKSENETRIASLTEYLNHLGVQIPVGVAEPNAPVGTTQPAGRLLPNPVRTRLQSEINQVKAQITDAKAVRQMTDLHPHVLGLRQKLDELVSQYERAEESIPADEAPSYIDVTTATPDPTMNERRRVEAELKSLHRVVEDAEKELTQRRTEKAQLEEEKSMLFERRQNFLMRQQEVSSAKADLRVWEHNLETIQRRLAAEEGDRGIRFATVESARKPSHPVSPTIAGVCMVSTGIGVALAALAVFLREMFDRTLRSPARVRQVLGIPVLEAIGEIQVGARRARQRRRVLMYALAGVQTLAVIVLAGLVCMSLKYPALYDHWIHQAQTRLSQLGIASLG